MTERISNYQTFDIPERRTVGGLPEPKKPSTPPTTSNSTRSAGSEWLSGFISALAVISVASVLAKGCFAQKDPDLEVLPFGTEQTSSNTLTLRGQDRSYANLAYREYLDRINERCTITGLNHSEYSTEINTKSQNCAYKVVSNYVK